MLKIVDVEAVEKDAVEFLKNFANHTEVANEELQKISLFLANNIYDNMANILEDTHNCSAKLRLGAICTLVCAANKVLKDTKNLLEVL